MKRKAQAHHRVVGTYLFRECCLCPNTFPLFHRPVGYCISVSSPGCDQINYKPVLCHTMLVIFNAQKPASDQTPALVGSSCSIVPRMKCLFTLIFSELAQLEHLPRLPTDVEAAAQSVVSWGANSIQAVPEATQDSMTVIAWDAVRQKWRFVIPQFILMKNDLKNPSSMDYVVCAKANMAFVERFCRF